MLQKGKKYYRIGEVSQIVGIEPHVLRFWEKEFRQIQPRRISGRRLYRQQDLETIRLIKQLLYSEGYTIAGARKRLERVRREGRGRKESARRDQPSEGLRPAMVTELRRELEEIRKLLSRPI